MSKMAVLASKDSKPNFGGFERKEMVMDLSFPQKPGLELMQNCDLPPPVKVFAGPDRTILSPMDRIYNSMVLEEENDEIMGIGNEKLELLKALRLSQTRAREAEKKAAVLKRERDRLWEVFMEDSSRLFAYQHWVKSFELQLARLQRQGQKGQFCSGCRLSNEEEDGKDAAGMTWFVAWALCLGVAGVGFAFGSRYFF